MDTIAVSQGVNREDLKNKVVISEQPISDPSIPSKTFDLGFYAGRHPVFGQFQKAFEELVNLYDAKDVLENNLRELEHTHGLCAGKIDAAQQDNKRLQAALDAVKAESKELAAKLDAALASAAAAKDEFAEHKKGCDAKIRELEATLSSAEDDRDRAFAAEKKAETDRTAAQEAETVADGKYTALLAKHEECSKPKAYLDTQFGLSPNGKVRVDAIFYGGARIARDAKILDPKLSSPGGSQYVYDLIAEIAANKGRVKVSNDLMGGDPWQGVVKSVVVAYRTSPEGETIHVSQHEYEDLQFC